MAPNSHDRPDPPSEESDAGVLDRYRVSEPSPGIVIIYDVENENAWIRSESPVDLSEVR
jgi:hypothetical protein